MDKSKNTNVNCVFSNETMWSTYEANVQAYRSNMIASQSFLLAVAALIYQKNIILEGVCIIIALLQLWYVWFRVIRARTIIVDYHKFCLGLKYDANGDELTETGCTLDERTYVSNKKVREKINNREFAKYKGMKKFMRHNWRISRIKIDLFLPITFTLLWISFFLFR